LTPPAKLKVFASACAAVEKEDADPWESASQTDRLWRLADQATI
jgi:hypothetical protein